LQKWLILWIEAVEFKEEGMFGVLVAADLCRTLSKLQVKCDEFDFFQGVCGKGGS
jgi:hypothetical protein